MTRRLRLTTYALADLDEIFEFLAARNPTAAHRYVSRLREQCDVYLTNPFMGQQEPGIAERVGEASEHVRSFLYRNHRCYYIVTDEEMRVLGFVDRFCRKIAFSGVLGSVSHCIADTRLADFAPKTAMCDSTRWRVGPVTAAYPAASTLPGVSVRHRPMICYVVNLERHHARLQSFLEQFDRSDLTASELRRFRAVDAGSVWPRARGLVYAPALARLAAVERRGFRQTHAEMPSRGGVGCALSHLCTWLDILHDAAAPESQRYVVMEDDASVPRRLVASVHKALQGVPAGWDILLLGCTRPRPSMVTKHRTHVDVRMFWRTHAYLVSKAAVRKIFANGALPVRVQIDAFLSGLAQAKKLKIYALPKSLVGQNLQHWESSIQLDYDVEHWHAKLAYDHPFEMATGATGVEDLERLDALRAQCGVERLR